jgi:hypothetical protein
MNETSGTPAYRLWIAWAFVGIPLIWGIAQVVKRSLDLFK